MPRRRSRQPPATGTATGTGWQWRTFPVFFAFASGVFLTALLLIASGGYAFWPVFLAGGAAMGFGLAHMFTRPIAVRRSQRLSQPQETGPAETPPVETYVPGRRRRRRRR